MAIAVLLLLITVTNALGTGAGLLSESAAISMLERSNSLMLAQTASSTELQVEEEKRNLREPVNWSWIL